ATPAAGDRTWPGSWQGSPRSRMPVGYRLVPFRSCGRACSAASSDASTHACERPASLCGYRVAATNRRGAAMTRPTSDRTIVPFLYHEDPGRAIDWLVRVFGAVERFRLTGPQGGVAHAEVTIGDDVVMIGNVGARNRARPITDRAGCTCSSGT